MSAPLDHYRKLEERLRYLRWLSQGLESVQEDTLLEEMDDVWWELSEEERAIAEAERPRSLIRDGLGNAPRRQLVDTDVKVSPSAAPRTTEEAA